MGVGNDVRYEVTRVSWAAEGAVWELIEREFFSDRERKREREKVDPPMCHSSKRKHVTFKDPPSKRL
jgi:hypothetical protein